MLQTQQNLYPNEIFALECRERYERDGVIVDKTNGDFAHCPFPKDMCDTGYYLTRRDHIVQGLLQSKDVNKCCFFVGETYELLTSSYFPPYDLFHLWDIYEKYASQHNRRIAKLGSSVNAGLSTYNKKVGLFAMTKEQKSAAGQAGAKTQYEQKIGMFAPGKHAATFRQKWISTEDYFVSSASGVARHNKKLNYDPKARICVDDLEASLIECLPIV